MKKLRLQKSGGLWLVRLGKKLLTYEFNDLLEGVRFLKRVFPNYDIEVA